jgi:hypothetical protein
MPLLVHDPDGRLSPRHAPRFDAAAHNPFASDQLGKRDGGFKGHRPAAQLGCALEETIIEGRQMPRSFGFGALVAAHGAPSRFLRTRPKPSRRLAKALNEMLESPVVRERFKTIGVVIPSPERRTPEYLAKFVVSELERWAVPIKAAGVTVD